MSLLPIFFFFYSNCGTKRIIKLLVELWTYWNVNTVTTLIHTNTHIIIRCCDTSFKSALQTTLTIITQPSSRGTCQKTDCVESTENRSAALPEKQSFAWLTWVSFRNSCGSERMGDESCVSGGRCAISTSFILPRLSSDWPSIQTPSHHFIWDRYSPGWFQLPREVFP